VKDTDKGKMKEKLRERKKRKEKGEEMRGRKGKINEEQTRNTYRE
jgi:hypothetical protein